MSSVDGTPNQASPELHDNRFLRSIRIDPVIVDNLNGTPSPPVAAAPDPNGAQGLPPDIITPRSLADETILSRLRLSCDASTDPMTFVPNGCLDWPSAFRINVLRFLRGLQHGYRLRHNEREFTDAFEFVLDQMVDDSNVARCEDGRRAAIQAAVVLHADALQPACNRIAGRLRQLGLQNVSARSVLAEARRLLQDMEPEARPAPQMRVRDIFPEAPVAAEAVVPTGWDATLAGILRAGQLVLSVAMFIIARLVGVDNTEMVMLAFYRDGRWQRREVSRAMIASPGKILSLASYGIPIAAYNNNHNREIVRYLSEYEQQNAAVIPVVHTTHRMGWNNFENPTNFLWGRVCLRAGDNNLLTDVDQQRPDTWPNDTLLFRGLDGGDQQIAAALDQQGSFSEWRDALAAIDPFPRLRFAFYAGLVPPLLTILRTPSFCVDICGSTSGGKTTGLMVGAASWGCPDQRSDNTLLPTWDSTKTYRERFLAVQSNLPIFIDEGSLRERDEDAVNLVYSVASGRGRGRGRGRGIGNTSTWATVAMVSGECPLVSLSNLGGLRARIFTLWGSPFGDTNAVMARTARQLKAALCENYGFAGPALVHYVLDNRNHWDEWRRIYRDYLGQYEGRAGDDPVVCRMAEPLAAIAVTAQIAHSAMQLPWAFSDPILPLWSVWTAEASDANRSAAALEYAVGWARSHQQSFFGRGRSATSQPLGGWAGYWNLNGAWIGFMPEQLEKVLRAGGFNFAATLRIWGDRRWILRDNSSGKLRHRTRIGGEQPWVIAITQEAIREVEGDAEPEEGQQGEDVRLADVG